MVSFYGEPDRPCYDIETEGIPKFIDVDFTELDKIEYIQRFRSGYGMDSSDDFENCRVMRHNYVPFEEYMEDREVKIYSPINGTIVEIWQIYVNVSGTWKPGVEDLATRIIIQSSEYPAFTIKLTMVDIREMDLHKGLKVYTGQHLGYACLRYVHTVTKISSLGIDVKDNTYPSGTKMLSYFDVITDTVFQAYKDRGATSREDFIISKEERDEDPLTCVYDPIPNILWVIWIFDKGNIPNWVYLGNDPSDFQIVYDYS